MRTAVERTTRAGVPLGPEFRISARAAWLAYTRWAAYLGLRERLVGSLEPGRLADFAVLDQNPLEWSPDRDNAEVRVLATWLGGLERYHA